MSDVNNEHAMAAGSSGSSNKIKGLLDAYAEIEQFSVAEAMGTEVDARYFTFRDRIEYFVVGLKSTLVGGLISLLFIPLAIGVIEKKVPAFGSLNPSAFDSTLVFIIALSFSIGYSLFFAGIGQLYVGNITKTMIRNLFGGITAAAIGKFIVAFIIYHTLYFLFLKEKYVIWAIQKLGDKVALSTQQNIYYWVMEFKPILLESTTFVGLTTVITIAIPWLSVGYKAWTSRKGQLKYAR